MEYARRVAGGQAQLAPDETIKSIEVADGLKLSLFAAEPMLMKPADIDVDAMGRVWVCPGVVRPPRVFPRPHYRGRIETGQGFPHRLSPGFPPASPPGAFSCA